MPSSFDAKLAAQVAKAPRWPTLAAPLPSDQMPAHVAIIMDGNGRWATQQGLVRVNGHRHGVESVRSVTRYCGQVHIKTLTLYAFSTENWKRPRPEITFLFSLLKKYLVNERPELIANNVRLTSIGATQALPPDVNKELMLTQKLTAGGTGLNLCLALNYGAQDEIVEGARTLLKKVESGELNAEQIDAELFGKTLSGGQVPPVSLLIRTAGERRLSNFLLWQSCGAEFHETPTCWPDFRAEHLEKVILESAHRKVPQ